MPPHLGQDCLPVQGFVPCTVDYLQSVHKVVNSSEVGLTQGVCIFF